MGKGAGKEVDLGSNPTSRWPRRSFRPETLQTHKAEALARKAIRVRETTVMQIAFALIHAESRSEGEVLQSLKEIEEVKEACSAYAVFNVIAKVKANSMDELEDIVDFEI